MEDVTATQSDVIKGKTAYVQGQDDPLPGRLELTGTATDDYVYPGKTYYSTDPKGKRTGTMPVQVARTITPGASAQTVAAGRYLTGEITVPGFSLPAANTIKKGVTLNIYGRTVVGTWEGYVLNGPQDWYYHGNNIKNFGSDRNISYTTDYMRIYSKYGNPVSCSVGPINFNASNYRQINIEVKCETSNSCEFSFSSKSSGFQEISTAIRTIAIPLNDTAQLSITSFSIFAKQDRSGYIRIYRIWLS